MPAAGALMKQFGIKLLAALLLSLPAAAAAEPVYFHTANVERGAFEADLS